MKEMAIIGMSANGYPTMRKKAAASKGSESIS